MNKFKISAWINRAKRRRGDRQWVQKTLLWLFILFVAGFVIGGATLLIMFKTVSQNMPSPDQLTNRQIIQSTKIYDRTGEHLLYEIHGEEKRTLIKFEDIPKNIIMAVISAEDRGFYEHQGINFRGLVRAIYKDIFHGKFEGGSSITQQLVTNALLSRGTTKWQRVQRKFREWMLSYQIEQKYTKDQIMQMYLNEIPFGSNAYGIEAAAKTFFDKQASQLSLAESALLAALPNKPTRYSPYGNNKEEMKARQEWILRYMKDSKNITEDEYEQAIKEELKFKGKKEVMNAPHFVMYIRDYLSEKYGEQTLEQGGLKVITTLDWDKQQLAEKIITEKTKDYPEKYNASNAALLSMEVKTGQILAMVGSRDYYNDDIDGQFNVTLSYRQPGSSFKPIVYATAWQKGYTPDTTLFDVETVFKNYPKDYTPHNYDLNEHGPVTMRKSLAGSLNIPAVKTLYLAGVDQVLNFADNLGYTTLKDRSRFGLSLVLGGGEVKMIEHLNAFTVFADDGNYKPATAILKIENADGKILEELKENIKNKIDKQIARLVNNVLSDNEARAYIFSANNFLNLGERPVAAKTGTTNDFHDAWTVGYTPSLATAVWVGNNDSKEMKRKADGSVVAAPIWHAFMKESLKDSKIENFPAPEPIETDKPILKGEFKIPYIVKIDKISGKLATDLTPKDYIEEKTFYQFHNILHYINKDDPRGEGNSQNDPQYENWETAVQAWVKKQQEKKPEAGKENEPNIYIITETPPTETDDTHTSNNQPTANFVSPANNSTITDRNFTASINYNIIKGEIKKVKYYLDDKLIKMVTTAPFTEFNYYFDQTPNGFHALKAEVYDSTGNYNFAEINLNLLFPSQSVSISWLGPLNNSSFSLTSMPLSLNIQLSDYTQTQKIEFYSNNKLINTVTDLNSNNISTSWEENDLGAYKLYAKVFDKQGNKASSEEVEVVIKP